MKLHRISLAVLLGFGPLALASRALTPQSTAARAEVVFLEPEKFTDVRDSYNSQDPNRAGYLDQLKDYVLKQARVYIPEGQKLQVTFTDIDMAGDFEPWRGPQWDDVRVIKSIYPPRIKLAYRVTDAQGNVIKQGNRELTDLAFQMRITMAFPDDPLRYEKMLLDDWFQSDFPRVKR